MKEFLYSSKSMSASAEEAGKPIFDRSAAKTDTDMIQYRVVVVKGRRRNKTPKDYNVHYNMETDRILLVYGVSVYHVPNARGEVE